MTEDGPTPPSGVVAFLFTDVVGSTRLWAAHSEAMDADLRRHDALLRQAITDHRGYVFSTAGDSFAAAFGSTGDAISAAVDAQRAIHATTWKVPGGILVRMGVHLGEASERDGDYFGPTLNEAARLMSLGNGGQVLVSARAAEFATGAAFDDLGTHTLRDVADPVQILQVVADGLRRDHEPIRSDSSYTSTLPSHLSSFIGREDELGRLRSMLASGRMVTITGVGGAGKTRVAIEVGAAERPASPGGVFFVDLAPVDEEDNVPAAFTDGIGLTGTDPNHRRRALVDFLAQRSVLLVVDNCEHLLDAAAELIEELLTSAPQLRVLATSREALEIDGEETFRLPSLAADGAAFRLFVDRATAVDNEFEVDAANRQTIVAICERLDGMPLAIELAASRCRMSTPGEVLAGLDDRFALLRAGRRRGVVQRQRTLEATIEWSHDLLDEDERAFFRRLGVYAGPFLMSTVPGVTGFSRGASLDLIDSLVAKSLLVPAVVRGSVTSYRLLETVKAFAIDRLVEAGEVDATRERYLDAFVQLCRDHYGRHYERLWVDQYVAQVSDLLDVIDALTEAGRIEDAVVVHATANYSPFGDAGTTAANKLASLEGIHANHASELSREWRAELIGSLAGAQINVARFYDAVATLEEMRPLRDVPVMYRYHAALMRWVINSSTHPTIAAAQLNGVIGDLRDAGAAPQEIRRIQVLQAQCHGLRRDYPACYAELVELYDPSDPLLPEVTLPFVFWLAHLLDMEPDASLVGDSDLDQMGFGYPHSIPVALTMAESRDDPETAAKRLVPIAARWLSGRLALEESEFLAAYARIAQLRGETDRALTLAHHAGTRTPFSNMVVAEVIGTIEAWPVDDWEEHIRDLVSSNSRPERIAELRPVMAQLLSEELDRWT